jgi:hypothetical protein
MLLALVVRRILCHLLDPVVKSHTNLNLLQLRPYPRLLHIARRLRTASMIKQFHKLKNMLDGLYPRSPLTM